MDGGDDNMTDILEQIATRLDGLDLEIKSPAEERIQDILELVLEELVDRRGLPSPEDLDSAVKNEIPGVTASVARLGE